MTITIGVPCITKNIYTSTFVCIGNLIASLQSQKVKVWIDYSQTNYEQAQSVLLSTWASNSTLNDLFILIRPDMYFTEQDIINMINLRAEVVCGNFATSNGESAAVQIKSVNESSQSKNIEYLSGPVGCILLRKNVVSKMNKLLIKDYQGQNISLSQSDQDVIPFFRHRMAARNDQNTANTTNTVSNGKQRSVWLDDANSFSWLIRQTGIPIVGYQSSTLGQLTSRTVMNKCEHSSVFKSGYKNVNKRQIIRENVKSAVKTPEQNVNTAKEENKTTHESVTDNKQRYQAPNFHPKTLDKKTEEVSVIQKPHNPYAAPNYHPKSIEDLTARRQDDSIKTEERYQAPQYHPESINE